MQSNFDITPEQRASPWAFFQRQLFRKPPTTTLTDVQLVGKTAIVTGSNTGIGFECSRQLLGLGVSRLILAVRSISKGDSAREALMDMRLNKDQVIEVWRLDLADYDSILEFTTKAKTLDHLDIVVHNAGIVNRLPEFNSKTGHDAVIQTNYLSLVLLTTLLLPILKEKNTSESPGRLTLVSSDVAAWAAFPERTSPSILTALDKIEKYEYTERYWVSKLLGQLFIAELARRVPSSVAIVNAPNPGLCYGTTLNADMKGSFEGFLFETFKRLLGRSPAVGARALTDAAVRHGAKSHGQYLEDGKLQPMSPLVYTEEGKKVAQKLWAETMEELSFAHLEDLLRQLNY